MRQETYHKFSVFVQTLSVMFLVIFSCIQCSINARLTEIQEETQLRPVILRANEISLGALKPIDPKKDYKDSSDLKQNHLLQFEVVKNIATDIEGQIIKDGFEYRLHFFDDLSEADKHKIECSPQWGWIKTGDKLYAFFSQLDREKTDKENNLILSYKDIKGNRYQTIENKYFSTCKSK